MNSLRVHRLTRFGLTSPDSGRLVRFFKEAFGCETVSIDRCTGETFEQSMRVDGGANRVTLTLGHAIIEVLQFDNPGAPYLPQLSPFDTEFQHFAIVVTDMARAFSQLSAVSGWTAISSAGPQHLPRSSGAVTAFKFRDPDGHILELLNFPRSRTPTHWQSQAGAALHLGIDHSAISVSDLPNSMAFYGSLGLRVAASTINQGAEQTLLDGISAPQVDVVSLAPPVDTPHVELLFYGGDQARRTGVMQSNDVSATRLIFELEAMATPWQADPADVLLYDPDGHHLVLRTLIDSAS